MSWPRPRSHPKARGSCWACWSYWLATPSTSPWASWAGSCTDCASTLSSSSIGAFPKKVSDLRRWRREQKNKEARDGRVHHVTAGLDRDLQPGGPVVDRQCDRLYQGWEGRVRRHSRSRRRLRSLYRVVGIAVVDRHLWHRHHVH